MKKSKKLLIEVDGSLLNEIMAKDNKEMFVQVDSDCVYYRKPIEKYQWIVSEGKVAYANEFLAINPNGNFLSQVEYNTVETADLEIHLNSKTVYKNGEKIKLSDSLYKILITLVMAKDGCLSRNTLIEILEIDDNRSRMIDENNLNQHMRRLRRALKENSEYPYFRSKYKYGYEWLFPIRKMKK
ncbi:winged helix-turn-helix domain-containing protein [Floccifex sp.]|uniref:winged helix-turn-helix domain-containing protein n=1 Tax=Floccifex sp. TaxID=2815810 RepID=UPI003F0D7590